MAVAAILMRRVVVDHARCRHAQRRGGNFQQLEVELDALVSFDNSAELLSLDRALTELAQFDERLARLVELRFFGGYSIAETASALDTSSATITRDWRLARAWLHHRVRAAQVE